MFETTPEPTRAIPTTLHLSPAVATAALMAAYRRGLFLYEWMDQVVSAAVTLESGANAPSMRKPTDDTAALFALVAAHHPHLLVGRWRLLYERVQLDERLWIEPRVTLDDIESGVDGKPVLDEAQLRHRWAELFAAALLI